MKVEIVQAPLHASEETILNSRTCELFLAGAIDNGSTVDWQQETSHKLAEFAKTVEHHADDARLVIYNPRRAKWDSAEVSDVEVMKPQVAWEQHNLLRSDIVLFYFPSNSKAPISLLEFGQCIMQKFFIKQFNLDRTFKLVIVCPKDFYRYCNIELMCKQYNIKVYETLDEGIAALNSIINNYFIKY